MGARGKDNSKWLTNVQPRLAEIREWCIQGLTNEDMSKRLDINPDGSVKYSMKK